MFTKGKFSVAFIAMILGYFFSVSPWFFVSFFSIIFIPEFLFILIATIITFTEGQVPDELRDIRSLEELSEFLNTYAGKIK